jgi:hypothetical protein
MDHVLGSRRSMADNSRQSPSDNCVPGAHVYKKGYYLGSDADFVCFICGAEASTAELDDEPSTAPS